MIRRLMEASYFAQRDAPPAAVIDFWLRELRTPELLIELAAQYSSYVATLLPERPLLAPAAAGDLDSLRTALAAEEAAEREKDRLYWEPLRRELERLRRRERRQP